MGYGQNLKEILKEKNITVKTLSTDTNISATTLYSAITRDSAIRFDYALRISSYLGIDPKEICATVPKDYEAKSIKTDEASLDSDFVALISMHKNMSELNKIKLFRYAKELLED